MEKSGKLCDADGNEIIIPKGHNLVCGNGSFAFIPQSKDDWSCSFVYREPDASSTHHEHMSKKD